MITGSNIGRSVVYPQAPNRISVLQKRDVPLRQGMPTTSASDCAIPAEAILLDLGISWQDSDLPAGGSVGVVDRYVPIIAAIHWGSGAGAFSAEVDWKLGTRLCLAASFIEVDAFYETTGANIWQQVQLAAAFAYGSSPSRAEPTRTLPRQTVAGSATVIVQIPAFAHSLIPFLDPGTPGSGPNITVTLLGGPLITDRIYATGTLDPLYDGGVGEGIRIPGAAKWVAFTNNDPDNSVDVTPMFGLEL